MPNKPSFLHGINDKLLPSPIVEINDPALDQAKIRLFLKRDDLIHPEISGNKWRKLIYNLTKANDINASAILTFGGAYSNHLTATAFACKELGMPSIGVVRGQYENVENPSLQFMRDHGMQLHYIDRDQYKERKNEKFHNELKAQFGNDIFIIPEGGSNAEAIDGCRELITELEQQCQEKLPDIICCSVGSGGTAAGLLVGLQHRHRLLGFSALKGTFLKGDIEKLILDYNGQSYQNWEINTTFHFGGFAKHQPELIQFINTFKAKQGIQLDPLYTGKMMFGIFELVKEGYFDEGQEIMAIHTGGLQGIQGFNQRFGNILLTD